MSIISIFSKLLWWLSSYVCSFGVKSTLAHGMDILWKLKTASPKRFGVFRYQHPFTCNSRFEWRANGLCIAWGEASFFFETLWLIDSASFRTKGKAALLLCTVLSLCTVHVKYKKRISMSTSGKCIVSHNE